MNLRVTGVGAIRRPALQPLAAGDGDPRRRSTAAGRCSSPASWHEAPVYRRDRLRAGDAITGPAVIQEFGSTLPIHPGFEAARRRARQRGGAPVIDPVLVEIVQGTLASIEAEVEEAIGRTARSPMIRDQHDFRAGIHDRAAAQADRALVLRARASGRARLPARDDAAGRRLLPQRRLPLRGRHRPPAGPVRHRARCSTSATSSRSCRPSATTTTSAGWSPARCPATPPRPTRKGLMVPPVKLFDAGVPERGRAADHRPQLAHAREPDRRHRRRVRRQPHGRPPGARSCSRATAARPSRRASTRSWRTRPRRSAARCWPRSRRGPTAGRTTPSTTASTRRGCTASG